MRYNIFGVEWNRLDRTEGKTAYIYVRTEYSQNFQLHLFSQNLLLHCRKSGRGRGVRIFTSEHLGANGQLFFLCYCAGKRAVLKKCLPPPSPLKQPLSSSLSFPLLLLLKRRRRPGWHNKDLLSPKYKYLTFQKNILFTLYEAKCKLPIFEHCSVLSNPSAKANLSEVTSERERGGGGGKGEEKRGSLVSKAYLLSPLFLLPFFGRVRKRGKKAAYEQPMKVQNIEKRSLLY